MTYLPSALDGSTGPLKKVDHFLVLEFPVLKFSCPVGNLLQSLRLFLPSESIFCIPPWLGLPSEEAVRALIWRKFFLFSDALGVDAPWVPGY